MKKMRKIIALLLGMVMALSLMPQTVLGTEFDGIPEYTTEFDSYFVGWEKSADGLIQNESTLFSCVTDEIAHNGNNSVVLRHDDSSQYIDKDLKIKQGINLGEGTYTLSFWAAGTVARQVDDPWRYQQVVWLWGSSGNGWFYVQDMNIVETDGDWTKYSMDFSVASGSTVAELAISIRGWATGLYLDDISLIKAGTTENLLTNGGFEETEDGEVPEGPEVPEVPTYTTAYDSYFKGWEKADDLTQNGSTVFSCVTDEIAHSGNNSVVLRHEDSSQYGKDLKIRQIVNLGEGTYTLSFWAAGTVARQVDDAWRYQQIVWLWGSSGEGWFYVQDMDIIETDGDWTKYSMDFSVASGSTVGELAISIRGWASGLYLDDISLVAQGATNNLLTNGGFEENEDGEVPEGPEVPEVPTYTTAYDSYFKGWEKADDLTQNGSTVFSCVTDEIAHSGNNSVVLRHEDSSQYGKDLKIRQVVNLGEGTYTLSFWAAGTVAVPVDNAWRYQQMVWLWGSSGEGWSYVSNMNIGETDGDWTKYSMDFTVPSGSTVGELGISSRGWTTGLYLDDISIVAKGTTENLLTNGGFEENEGGEVPEGPTYTNTYENYFTSWVRADVLTQNESTVFSCVTDEIAHTGSNSVVLRHEDESQYEKDLKIKQSVSLGEGTYTLSFWAAGTVATNVDSPFRYQQIVWIPDVGEGWFYVQDMNIGETDGDWTKYSMDFTVESGKQVTELSISIRGWATGLYLDDISLVKAGTTENLIKNGSFEERDPNAPVGDVVKEVVLNKNGQRVNTLDGQGDYSVTLILDNYAIDTVLNVDQLVAIHNENKVLYKVYSTKATVEKATANGAFTKIETNFTLPEGNFTVEYFVFDGRDTLNIIGNPNPHRIFE